MKVLLIEDSPETVKAVSLCFNVRWPEAACISTGSGVEGIKLAEDESPNIIILEIKLPDIEGFEVLQSIRHFSDVPIIILSVMDGEMDKLKGLEMGADDYITKPFGALDLISRVKAAMRRVRPYQTEWESLPPFTVGELTIDFSARLVTLGSRPLHLTPIEYKLLCYLVRNAGKVVSHQAMAQHVWGAAEYISPRTVKKFVYQLRMKLSDNATRPRFIQSERGIGYCFSRP